MPPCSRLSRSGPETLRQTAPLACRPSLTAARNDGVENVQAGTERCSRPNRLSHRVGQSAVRPDTISPVHETGASHGEALHRMRARGCEATCDGAKRPKRPADEGKRVSAEMKSIARQSCHSYRDIRNRHGRKACFRESSALHRPSHLGFPGAQKTPIIHASSGSSGQYRLNKIQAQTISTLPAR
jgi:hypothetical protein